MPEPTTSEAPPARPTAGGALPALPALPALACANCGAALSGPYCAQCGQKAAHRVVSLRHILEDALEDQLSLNAALPRTLKALFLHPGRLTREYVSGRVVSYIPPMRLYLIASVLFFLALAALPGGASHVQVGSAVSRQPAVAGRQAATPAPSGGRVAIQVGPIALVADTVGLPGWAKPTVARLVQHQERLGGAGREQAGRELIARLADDTPKVIFVLLPLFALLLKLLYIRRRRLYVEHFVFALHVHALAFFVFTILLPIRWPVASVVAYAGIAFYLFRAMGVVYGQGWGRTFAKFALLTFTYLLFLAVGLSAVVALALSSI